MSSDSELLREFAATRSDAAFTELVRRHLSMVYYAALRQLAGDSHAAQDVAQSVFTDLARKAATLTDHATLAGWLHRSARYAAAKIRRAEEAKRRKQEDAMRADAFNPNDGSAIDWEKLRPVIDGAVDELSEQDRQAVLLRFFEAASFAVIGRALDVSEDAARMRVERALEKVRVRLGRRGVTSTVAALSLVMTQQLSAEAPAALTATVVQGALAATVGAVAPAAGIALFMAHKSLLTASAVALAAVCAALFEAKQAQASSAVVSALMAERQDLRQQLQTERERSSRSGEELASLAAQIESMKAKAPLVIAPAVATSPQRVDSTLGMPRWEIQQGALGNLQQIDSARKQYKIEHGRAAASVVELVGRDRFIKVLRTVAGEDYSGLSMNPEEPMSVTTPGGITVTFDPSGTKTTRPELPPEVARAGELAERVRPAVKQAVQAFQAAHNGLFPPNEQALLPYFASPKDGADYIDALEAKKAAGL